MHTPEYVLEKARKRYHSVWRDGLLGTGRDEFTVPLDPPSAAAITDRAGEVSAWLTQWRQWDEQHPGITLRTRTVRTKFGSQPLYTHVDIPGVSALASLNPDTAAHWLRACDRWEHLRDQSGQTVRPWLARIIELDNYDFATLLAAADWFRAHPRSGLTVRSVPVPGMHTKWLAKHRSLLLACLGTTDSALTAEPAEESDDPCDIPAAELDALGLRPLPREISIVLADSVMRAAVGGLRQITAPVDELAELQIHADLVLIVENKEPALSWPDTRGLVIIHSLGNHLDVLQRLPWLRHDRCWYWGDLDRHGFTILSRARELIPQLESLLMETSDVETYHPLGVQEDLSRYDHPEATLTPAETSALTRLQVTGGKYLRIEQERIPPGDAQRALQRALDRAL